MQIERINLDGLKLREKDDVQAQLAYELHTAQEALHVANCRWGNDNVGVSAQIAALQGEISDVQERSASAFTRENASHARAMLALQDRMALHNIAAEQAEKRLVDMNSPSVTVRSLTRCSWKRMSRSKCSRTPSR
eukprot:5137892-Heterocapsa_arctica.AAC.1